MVISLIILFLVCMSLSLIEERLKDRDKKIIYILIGAVMVLIAGLREPGSTPDSETYEEMYNGTYDDVLLDITEPTFTLISYVLNSMSLGVNALFLTYALISVSIHMSALWKLSKLPFMTLSIYVSFYFMMHDMVQIRCSVASGLFIWAMYFYNDTKKWYTFLCIFVGIFFHYSAATGFVIFLLDFKIRRWEKIAMYLLIPIGIVSYYKLDISSFIPESVGGEKLIAYRKLKDMGLDEDQGGYPLTCNLVIWLNVLVYYASIYYERYLSHKVNYIVLAIKVQTVAFCCLFFLNGVTMVLSSRLNSYFSVASLLLWTSFVYLFTPLNLGKIINSSINFIRFITSMLFFALSLYFQ